MPMKSRSDRLKALEDKMKALAQEKKKLEADERRDAQKAHHALLRALGQAAYQGGLRRVEDVTKVCAEARKVPALKERFSSDKRASEQDLQGGAE